MDQMVERVAEVIAISGNGGTWDDWYNEEQKEFHRRRARAVLAIPEIADAQNRISQLEDRLSEANSAFYDATYYQ